MRKIVVILTLLQFLISPGYCGQPTEDNFTKSILDNGMTVLVTEMPSSPVVSVYALVKTGSATEGEFLGTGISHFLEHMLFKGTHGRGTGEIATKIQAVGGEINAATGKDYTIYTIKVPYDQFDVALEILSDMLMNATMEPEEVERERTVIFSEMRMGNDDPGREFEEIKNQAIYLNHPYRHPIIGYESALAGVTRDDLMTYYRRFYIPNNIIFSVAGNINAAEVLPKITAAFQSFKRGRSLTRNLPQEPPQISRRHYEKEYPTDLARLSLSFSGISLLHPDLYALDVLAAILGQGESSRLYLTVYKQAGLVHSVTAYNDTPIDRGDFSIDCLLEEDKIAAATAAILVEIDKIKQSGVNREELEKVKQQVKSRHVLARQTASSVNFSQAIDEAFTGDAGFSRKYVNAIGQVTPEEILRVANAYLSESALSTVVLRPITDKQAKGSGQSPVSIGPIEKHVLPNGLVVLTREDHTFPVVSLQLSLQGGIRHETAELNGLSQMTASAWIKGTDKLTAEEIARKTESLGMDLSSFSGRNSLGIQMQFLSEQWGVALDLLKGIVLHPTFPDDEITKIRETMQAAIRQREDSVFMTSAQALKEELFPGHPYSMDEDGTLETVAAIRRADLVSFYERLAVPGNMVLTVFGDIDSGQVMGDLKKIFGELKSSSAPVPDHAVTPLTGQRSRELSMDKEQALALIGFQGAALGSEDVYGLEVAAAILGSSFSGRIFNNIRDQLGNAYSLGGDYLPGLDVGFIYFYVMTSDDEVEKVVGLLKNEIKKVQTDLVTSDELKNIKTYLKGTFRASQETNSALGFMTGLDELYGLGYAHYLDYEERVDGVTAEGIRDIARRYFNLDHAAVVVTRPKNPVQNEAPVQVP